MPSPIRQEIVINASPDKVYAALTDADKFSGFSGGAPAQIDATDGGEISLFGGAITGRNIQLVPNQMVVQAWRVSQGDGAWGDGVYSIVRFELKAKGGDTEVILEQDGFPEAAREHLDPGWHKMYWEPLREFLK